MKARKLSDSPCIGKCSTSVGDDVCTGCLRSLSDIANWLMWSEDERAASNASRHQQIIAVMQDVGIQVIAPTELQARMQTMRLRRTDGADPLIWLFEALCSSRSHPQAFQDLVAQPHELTEQWQQAKQALVAQIVAVA